MSLTYVRKKNHKSESDFDTHDLRIVRKGEIMGRRIRWTLLASFLGLWILGVVATLVVKEAKKNSNEKNEKLEERTSVEEERDTTDKRKRKREEFIAAMTYIKDKNDREEEYYSSLKEIQWEMGATLMEAILQDEQKDTGWSREIYEKTTEMLMREEHVGTRIAGIDCRDTLCRIEFEHASLEDYDMFKSGDFIDRLPCSGGDQHGRNDAIDEERSITTIFFARKGDNRAFKKLREKVNELLQ